MSSVKVQNKKIIRKLTMRALKAGKARNIVAIVAIALTATLFTSIFAIGGNIIVSTQNVTMRSVGSSAHGGFKDLTQEQYDNISKSPDIRDISYNIIISVAENEALQKKQTEIRYSEDKAAQWGFSYPTIGGMPRAGRELACSTITLDMLGLPHELGQQVPLEFSVHGKKYAEEFTLSGFWPGDNVMMATQVYLSREYTDSIIQVPEHLYSKETFDDVAGTIQADVWFSSSYNIEQKLDAVLAERGYAPGEIMTGTNWAYLGYAAIDPTTAVITVLLILLILISGYLIIYSVFTISVTGDIRFYGLLKTIGATGRQLRRIVRGQALALAAAGIPLGFAAGYLLGYALTPTLMSMTTITGAATVTANPLIFLFSGLFSLVTVFISCRKPGRIAARVSPVEAVRYSEARAGKRKEKSARTVTPPSMAVANILRTPKKLALIVVSLSLSMILLNSVYSAVNGFDMELYLENTMLSDFSLADYTVYSVMSSSTNYSGVDENVLEGIAALEGLTDMANIRFRDDYKHQLSETGRANMIKALEYLGPRIEKEYGNWPDVVGTMQLAGESGIAPIHIYGVGGLVAEALPAHRTTFEQLASGNYLLMTHIGIDYDYSLTPTVYGPGDKVLLRNTAGEQREFEVLESIDDYPYAISCQHGHIIDSEMIMADNIFQDFFGEEYPMMTVFNVDDEHIPAAEAWLADYTTLTNKNLDYRSRDFYKGEFENLRRTYMLAGGTLAFILALIGVLNFINAIFTSITARRQELAMLQSVGMTGRQLRWMLFGEGASYALLTVLFSVTAGAFFSRLVTQAIAGEMWFFKPTFSIMPTLYCALPLLLICAAVPLICYRWLARGSLVERLRVE